MSLIQRNSFQLDNTWNRVSLYERINSEVFHRLKLVRCHWYKEEKTSGNGSNRNWKSEHWTAKKFEVLMRVQMEKKKSGIMDQIVRIFFYFPELREWSTSIHKCICLNVKTIIYINKHMCSESITANTAADIPPAVSYIGWVIITWELYDRVWRDKSMIFKPTPLKKIEAIRLWSTSLNCLILPKWDGNAITNTCMYNWKIQKEEVSC